MQQQVNQMMMQITAGIFGRSIRKDKIEKEADLDVAELQGNFSEIVGLEADSPADAALTVAAEAIGKKNARKMITQAQKDYAARIAKGEAPFTTPPDKMTKGGK